MTDIYGIEDWGDGLLRILENGHIGLHVIRTGQRRSRQTCWNWFRIWASAALLHLF